MQAISPAQPVGGNDDADDQELIDRFRLFGDRQAFRLLVERHIPSIRRMLYALFNGQREDMEDAEQDVLLALHQSLKRYRAESSFKTYLYRLCRNRGVDLLRKKSRERKLLRLVGSRIEPPPPDPEEQVLEMDEGGRLLNILQTMDPDSRMLILLKDVEKVKISEISRIMQLPVGTIKSRLHRARAALIDRFQAKEVGIP